MARELPADLSAVWSLIPLTPHDLLGLEKASHHPFREPVTAYLTAAYGTDGVCIGVVWGHELDDQTGRFANGHRIITSRIVAIEWDEDFPVIRTLNSRYVVISLHPKYMSLGTTVH